MKIITLPLSNGVEMSFSEQELIAIVEKHLSSADTKKTTTAKVAQKPTEDAWFEVKPHAIDQKLFEKEREDNRQESMRVIIIKAFYQVKENPDKYGRNFNTMMPKKTWTSKTVAQLKEMASELGDHNADWVEQALEWAQRIANGESWEAICNDKDTANWYRLVVWWNGYNRLVGGSVNRNCGVSASDVDSGDNAYYKSLSYTVPLVVSYK